MRKIQTKQTLKLRLLAIVLALALVWYSLNPAPGPIIRNKREAEPPDEKKRKIDLRSMQVALPIAFRPVEGIAGLSISSDEDEDDFEWPEFIDG